MTSNASPRFWLTTLDGNLHAKLVKAGLTEPGIEQSTRAEQTPEVLTLCQFLDGYFKRRADLK